jgi:molecular chaperone GrpE
VDLAAVVAQIAALRHEVNLQTKASRAATEQTAEALKLAAAPKPSPDPDDAVKPLVKTLVDIADALLIGKKQAEAAARAANDLAAELRVADPVPTPPDFSPLKPGWFARLRRSTWNAAAISDEWFAQMSARRYALNHKAEKLNGSLAPLLAGLADGYAMSLRRVERAFPQFGLEPLAVVGEPFDPDTMEAAEAVDDPEAPPGTVVEEVRPGYTWHGKPFRFALVKVAR